MRSLVRRLKSTAVFLIARGQGRKGGKKGSAKSYREIAAIVTSDSIHSTFRIQLARVTSLGGDVCIPFDGDGAARAGEL